MLYTARKIEYMKEFNIYKMVNELYAKITFLWSPGQMASFDELERYKFNNNSAITPESTYLGFAFLLYCLNK